MYRILLLRWFAAIAFVGLVATPLVAEEADRPALIYSSWTKFCLDGTCFVGKDGRLSVAGKDGRSNVDCGPVVAAVFIEPSSNTKKILRVTLPTRVRLERGVRIIIDQGQAIERPYVSCVASGCMAEYAAGAELVDQLKEGTTLFLQAIDQTDSPINLAVPLVDFAKAYDGPPQEGKVFEKIFSSKQEMQASSKREKQAEDDRKAWCEARQVR